jgi:hypothetical protein
MVSADIGFRRHLEQRWSPVPAFLNRFDDWLLFFDELLFFSVWREAILTNNTVFRPVFQLFCKETFCFKSFIFN